MKRDAVFDWMANICVILAGLCAAIGRFDMAAMYWASAYYARLMERKP